MKQLFILCVFLVAGLCAQAQKYGHINYGNLLEGLPQVEAANKQLATFQDSLGNVLATQQKALDARVQESTLKFQSGEMAPSEADRLNQALNQEQQRLVALQQSAERAILAKREGLLKPIVQRASVIIQAFGKEKGYAMIFDESAGYIMHDLPADDLTETIKAIVAE